MGITGLLKFVHDATDVIHVKKYAGKTVAVDTYCWIHRGSFACAEKLAKNENTDQYVKYCMKFIDMLESYHVKVVLVFDGCRLPSKELVERERHKRRKENLEKGKQFLREGKLTAARDCFTKCISVTPAMALRVMEAARARGVDCIVAPYEADAQLAFFAKTSKVQAIVTEDSDLLCFGCKNVIFKMDLTGRAQEVCMDNIGRVKHLADFTPDLFRHMCILSGCDYLPSVKGVGLVKACKALKLSKSRNSYQIASRLHQYVKGLSPVDPSYGSEFERADKTFLYQLVFDPSERKLKPLNDYPKTINVNKLDFAGSYFSDEKAFQIALGNIDINTHLVIGYFDINVWIANRKPADNLPSVWCSTFDQNLSKSTNPIKPLKRACVEKQNINADKKILSSSNVVTAVIHNSRVAKNSPPENLQESEVLPPKVSIIQKVVGNIADFLQIYSDGNNKTLSNSNKKSPAKVVKSRFFASPNVSHTPQDFETISTSSFNNSNSIFSSVKSPEDTVLSDILSEMTEHVEKFVTPKKRNGSALSSSYHKKRKKISSSYEELQHISHRRKKKKLNLPISAINFPQPEQDENRQANSADNDNGSPIVIQDEAIPYLDDTAKSHSLFEISSQKSPTNFDSQSSPKKSYDDECIPILDSDDDNCNLSTERKPLDTIENQNQSNKSQSLKNSLINKVDCNGVEETESRSKLRNRRLGLPSKGKFTSSPVKLNLSKYFNGSKASGLRKANHKVKISQKSIFNFFCPKTQNS